MKSFAMIQKLAVLLALSACAAPLFAQEGVAPHAEAPKSDVKEVYYGRRLEPRRGVLHGIGQSDDAFSDYYARIGAHKPALYMTYNGLSQPDKTKYFEGLRAQLAKFDTFVIPQIGVGLGKAQQVADGKHDAAIEALCQGLKSLGRPSFIRIGYEFNGEWNNLQPEPFKAAWIRVVKAIRAHGLNEVATVWCYAPEGMHKNYMDYFPGEEWVDWWGIDLFSPEHFSVGDTHLFLKDAAKARYPVMIGESSPRWVGVDRGEKSWRTWFARYFGLIRSYPQIKSFCYITYDWAAKWKPGSALADWGDARVWADPIVWQKWQAEMQNPLYIHAGNEAQMRRILAGVDNNAAPVTAPQENKP